MVARVAVEEGMGSRRPFLVSGMPCMGPCACDGMCVRQSGVGSNRNTANGKRGVNTTHRTCDSVLLPGVQASGQGQADRPLVVDMPGSCAWSCLLQLPAPCLV